ncbi:MAG: 2-oxo acid dehydrogenase subunit E2, partial [Candidatus Longimicrobiales bacterium M2_2A_002]
LDVDLEAVEGSGPQGRVTADDVEAAAGETEGEPEEAAPEAEEAGVEGRRAPGILGPTLVEEVPSLPDFGEWGEVERTKLRSVRRTIAERMAVSWSQIPHVTHEDVADITALESLRQEHVDEVEEAGGSLTLTAFVLKAAVAALKEHPRFNASLDVAARELILKKYHHVGVAVHTERGLMVPVIRDVDRKSIRELAVELTELAERTREGDVKPGEMRGGTFTVTNPGTIGGTAFTPIINWPQVAILGTARAREVPVVEAGMGDEAGSGPSLSTRLELPLVLGFDHRVNDGADAARFVRTVVEVLEDPERLLLET